jgi:hypothetical protein
MGNYELTKIWDLEFVESEAIESRIDQSTGRRTDKQVSTDECIYILPDGVPCRIRYLMGENIDNGGTRWYQIAIIGMSVITASTQGVNEVLEREIIKRTTSEWETIN